MTFLARHPAPVAVVAVTGAVLLFARPQFHPKGERSEVQLPAHEPAADVSGAAGWAWPDGVPGWEAGRTYDDYNPSGVQPVEIEAARLAAARFGLDADGVRVLASVRGDRRGALALLAAPTNDLYRSPTVTCLGVMPIDPAPVRWFCPTASGDGSDLAHARVLVGARALPSNGLPPAEAFVDLAGVARGDVRRIVARIPGRDPQELYVRGATWGEFSNALSLPQSTATLEVFDDRGLAETLPLDLRPGEQRVLR